MVLPNALILLTAGFAAAVAIAALLLAGPERLRVYAHPNVRSLHAEPTPTGGGVAFVVPIVAYLVWVAAGGAAAAAALALGGVLLALIGFWDDRRELSKSGRFATQLLVAAGVAWIVLQQEMAASNQSQAPAAAAGWLVAVVALVLVWQVNLYNFMDGIDGLAGAQALVFAVGAQIVGGGVAGWVGDLLWLTAGASLGFLVWNWPPARVFMGDGGSYFLGLLSGAVAVLLWRQQALALPVSLILLAGFWFDATYTLIVRAATRQAFTQPHRTHLYQKIAARRGHLWTTVCYLVYSAVWLLPLSWFCAQVGTGRLRLDLLWVLPAVTPLALAAWYLRAGLPEPATGESDDQ